MNLKDHLSKKGKAPKPNTTVWLPFCTLDVTTGSLWAGDPHLANADDGCVVKVPPGRYVVEGRPGAIGRDRIVSRLRVRLQSEKNLTLGKELGDTGTDSAMIGVCDIKAFDKALGKDPGDEVQDAIEAQTDDGFGIIKLKKFPGTVMPFVPTGSDGSGPVFALTAGRKRVGIELAFMDEEEDEPSKKTGKGSSVTHDTVSLMGTDREGFITRRSADGKEASFWYGGDLGPGKEFSLWSSAKPGPVEYRIRRASGSVLKAWSPMKKKTGGSEPFCAYETLKAGTYEFDFRIGKEVFSGLKLTLK